MLVFATLLPLRAASVQGAPRPMSTPPADSAAWQPILTQIIASLTHHIMRAALDTTPQSWRMTFPASGLPWEQVETHLRAALRARAAAPDDTIVYDMTVGPLLVASDTARVELRTSMVRRCPGSSQLTGSGNVETLFVVRHERSGLHFWSAARSAGIRHGDRAGCPRR
jgi:hypothetical protein